MRHEELVADLSAASAGILLVQGNTEDISRVILGQEEMTSGGYRLFANRKAFVSGTNSHFPLLAYTLCLLLETPWSHSILP